MREIGPDLDKIVEELHRAFRGTEVSETLQIHKINMIEDPTYSTRFKKAVV